MITGDESLGDYIAKEVVFHDCYRLREYPTGFFQTIFDIGANVGFFSVMARMHSPKAEILAYEPCEETFMLLQANTRHLKILSSRLAMANGSALYLKPGKNHGSHKFWPEETFGKSPQTVPSRTLSEIVASCTEVGRYMLKIDCEGGEAYLLDGSGDAEIRGAHHVAMEFHFAGVRTRKYPTPPPGMPCLEEFEAWAKRFEDTHEVAITDVNEAGIALCNMKKRQS